MKTIPRRAMRLGRTWAFKDIEAEIWKILRISMNKAEAEYNFLSLNGKNDKNLHWLSVRY